MTASILPLDRQRLAAIDHAHAADAVVRLARGWDEANGAEVFPAERLQALGTTGALEAFAELPTPGAVAALSRVLRAIGGADLSLGRIFEGHVNAVQLVRAYGSAAQQRAVGGVLGVWNTEPAPGMTIARVEGGWRLGGAKSFATGGGHLGSALITARDEAGAKRMVLVDIAREAGRFDASAWRVRGMRGTESGTYDFEGIVVPDVIGAPGDYEREPRFSAGAWRFAAVQLGAIEALLRHWRDHLVMTGKGDDAVQRLRFGACVGATRSAGLWVAQAAGAAERGDDDAIPLVLMTRGLVEDAGLQVMEGAARAVGTASFFEDSRIDRITRDLGLYLRQPVPDQARDRAAAAWLASDHWGEDRWW